MLKNKKLIYGWLLSSMFLLLTACDTQEDEQEPIRPVRVVALTQSNIVPEMVLSGEVRARVESRLGFRVPGKIQERRVELGDKVKKGDLIARLEPSGEQLTVRAAEARVQSIRADLKLAQTELERVQALHQKGYASPTEYDRYKIQVDNARAGLQQAQADLNMARNQLEYTQLVADENGVVVQVAADAGEVVSAGQPVVQIAREDILEVEVFIPEDKKALAEQGQATLTLYTLPDQKFVGKLREISASVDPFTRMFKARYQFVDAPSNVALGQVATVLLSSEQQITGLTLPLRALVGKGDDTHVWVFNEETGTVALTPVQPLGVSGNSVMVAGLEVGAQVVTAGVHVLVEGQRVRPVAEK
ncbi:MAG TPA: efflux RND transporter periplasmic adaptor subunit [Alcanivoracaceae bacterium]|nr:efflux RND transporter periplasmic adaptor subunit [Alcanivoracaceae bacterium]